MAEDEEPLILPYLVVCTQMVTAHGQLREGQHRSVSAMTPFQEFGTQ